MERRTLIGAMVVLVTSVSKFAFAGSAKPTTFKGTITEIKDDVISVKDKDGKKVKFTTDANTEVIIEGKKSKVSNLVSGMEVTVTPPTKGLATRIEVTKK